MKQNELLADFIVFVSVFFFSSSSSFCSGLHAALIFLWKTLVFRCPEGSGTSPAISPKEPFFWKHVESSLWELKMKNLKSEQTEKWIFSTSVTIITIGWVSLFWFNMSGPFSRESSGPTERPQPGCHSANDAAAWSVWGVSSDTLSGRTRRTTAASLGAATCRPPPGSAHALWWRLCCCCHFSSLSIAVNTRHPRTCGGERAKGLPGGDRGSEQRQQ